MRTLPILLLLLVVGACSTMRGKRIEARYARRVARSPEAMTLLRDAADVGSSTGQAASAAAAPAPPPRAVIPAPPPADMTPFTPSPSPLLKSHRRLGSDRYCGGQACRDIDTASEWHRSL